MLSFYDGFSNARWWYKFFGRCLNNLSFADGWFVSSPKWKTSGTSQGEAEGEDGITWTAAKRVFFYELSSFLVFSFHERRKRTSSCFIFMPCLFLKKRYKNPKMKKGPRIFWGLFLLFEVIFFRPGFLVQTHRNSKINVHRFLEAIINVASAIWEWINKRVGTE